MVLVDKSVESGFEQQAFEAQKILQSAHKATENARAKMEREIRKTKELQKESSAKSPKVKSLQTKLDLLQSQVNENSKQRKIETEKILEQLKQYEVVESSIEARQSQVDNKIRDLRMEQQELKLELQKIMEKQSSWSRKSEEYKQKLAQFELEYANADQDLIQFKEKRFSLAAEISQCKSKIQSIESQLSGFLQEQEILKDSIVKLSITCKDAKRDVEEKQKVVDETIVLCQRAKLHADENECKLKKARDIFDQVKESVSENNANLAQSRKLHSDFISEQSQVSSNIHANESKIVSEKLLIAEIEEKISTLKEQKDEKEKLVHDLQSSNLDSQELLTRLDQDLKKSEMDSKKLEEMYRESMEQSIIAKQKVSECELQAKCFAQKKVEAEKEKIRALGFHRHSLNEFQNYDNQLQEKKQIRSTLGIKLSELETMKRQYLHDNEILDMDQINRTIQHYEENCTALKAEIENTKSQLSKYDQTEFQTRIESFETRIANIEVEINGLMNWQPAPVMEEAHLRSKIADLHHEAEIELQEIEKMKREISNASNEMIADEEYSEEILNQFKCESEAIMLYKAAEEREKYQKRISDDSFGLASFKLRSLPKMTIEEDARSILAQVHRFSMEEIEETVLNLAYETRIH